MTELIRNSLRQRKTAIVAYCLAGLGLILLYVAIYPSLQAQIGSYNQLVKALPATLLKAFGVNATQTDFEGLLGTKQYGLVWPLLCIFYMVSLAGVAIAGEIEKTTIGLWLAAPLSRLKIYWSKFVTSLLALVVFVLLSVLAVIPIAGLFKVHVTDAHIFALTAISFLFGFCITGLAFFASAIFSEKSRVYATVGSVLLIMYVLNILAAISSNLVDLKYLSFFYYYNASDLLAGQPISHLGILIFGLAGIVFGLAGANIFKRRDISI